MAYVTVARLLALAPRVSAIVADKLVPALDYDMPDFGVTTCFGGRIF
jgi:hypothetical protein